MPRNKTLFPNAPVVRVMKTAGAGRVSDQAVAEIAQHVLLRSQTIAKEAVGLSQHVGRTTLMANDIRLTKK